MLFTIEELLTIAKEKKASDVHVTVGLPPRIRINGELVDLDYPKMTPADCEELILSIMDERQKELFKDRGELDFSFSSPNVGRYRVNVFRQRGSVACAMRVVGTVIPKPESLGVPKSVIELYAKKRGLVLVTGPTGSGKSTTLYAALSQLAEKKINCVTVEDPVEKLINGVTQVQVNAKAGLTFATALRSILRQDPDVIMVGEIRDEETADIGVRAAVTGHLVLSTLHTNDCVSAVYRLQNMGIPFYMIAAATTGVVAQRLVKVLCPHCRRKIKAGQQTKRLLYEVSGKEAEEVWEAVGCEECLNTGYSHRRAIYEMFELNETTKNMIRDGETAEKIRRYQRERGFLSLQEQAAQMVMNGEMDMEEAEKVIYSAD